LKQSKISSKDVKIENDIKADKTKLDINTSNNMKNTNNTNNAIDFTKIDPNKVV